MRRCLKNKNIIDNLRLKILLRIENNIDDSFKFDVDYCERNNLRLIITDEYHKLCCNPKKEIETIINGVKFTKLEVVVIHAFTGFGSEYINRELASPATKINLHKKIIIDVFDRVLRKIERTKKDYLYRMDKEANKNKENALAFFDENIDQVINIPWFLSTTEYHKPWCDIVWKIAILDKTKTKARCFHPLTNNHADELEVRFERNVKLRINNIETVTKEENGEVYNIVNMEEVCCDDYDINMDYTKYII